MAVVIKGLRGVFTCTGFVAKGGRWPQLEDAGFLPGPIDIRFDGAYGSLVEMGAYLQCSNQDHVVDGTDLVAMPGFFDSHTHPIYFGNRAPEFFMRWKGASYLDINASGGGIRKTVKDTTAATDDDLLSLLIERFRAMRQRGIVAVEAKSGYAADTAGELRLLRILARARANDAQDMPQVLTTFLGLHALPDGANESAYVDAMISMLPLIAENKLADFVDAFPEVGFFSLEQSVRFVTEAQKYGLQPKIHADEMTDMKASETFCKMGALSVDHLLRINPESIPKLATSNIVATLMPATSFYLGLPYANARTLLNAGVRVALASDFNPGTAPYIGLGFAQLLAASQLHMSPAEILCASVTNGATAMGLQASSASVVSGMSIGKIIFWRVSKVFRENDPDSFLAEIFTSMTCPVSIASPHSQIPYFA